LYHNSRPHTAADFSVVVVAVVVVALTEVAAVSDLRVLLTDRITHASAAFTPAVTAAQGASVVSATTRHNARLMASTRSTYIRSSYGLKLPHNCRQNAWYFTEPNDFGCFWFHPQFWTVFRDLEPVLN